MQIFLVMTFGGSKEIVLHQISHGSKHTHRSLEEDPSILTLQINTIYSIVKIETLKHEFFVGYKVTVASSILKQEKNESLLTPPKIKSYLFDCFYHSIVTEKQMPEVRITQILALKSNIFMYLKYKTDKLMKMLRHTKLVHPEKESTSILYCNQWPKEVEKNPPSLHVTREEQFWCPFIKHFPASRTEVHFYLQLSR